MIGNRIFRSERKSFQRRGQEIYRVEALSDAVFAFSVSLLVASLEVPQTFAELKSIAAGALPFFATVAMIFLFWYQQYLFFRRYGVNDFKIILLNLMYLAVILFYVYPLKFLFALLISSWSGIDLFTRASEQGLTVLPNEDFPQLIILFSAGYCAIWLLIFLMHLHVFKRAASIDLNRYELILTKAEMRGALLNAAIGFTGLVLGWLSLEVLAGVTYLLIPAAMAWNHFSFQRQVKRGRESGNRVKTMTA